MSAEIPTTVFFPAPAEAAQEVEAAKQLQEQLPPPPSPEEARAVEAIFAQQEEAHLVSGLLGMWTGAMVLKDIAAETFGRSEEDDEPDPRKKKKDPAEDEPCH